MITHKLLSDLEKEIISDGIFFTDYKGFSFSDLVKLAHVGLAYQQAKEDMTTDCYLEDGVYEPYPKITAPEFY